MTTIHKIKWFTLSAIVILFLLVVIQNTGVTRVRFMGWEAEASRILLISGVGLSGFVAGILTLLLIQHRQCRSHPVSVGSSKPNNS